MKALHDLLKETINEDSNTGNECDEYTEETTFGKIKRGEKFLYKGKLWWREKGHFGQRVGIQFPSPAQISFEMGDAVHRKPAQGK